MMMQKQGQQKIQSSTIEVSTINDQIILSSSFQLLYRKLFYTFSDKEVINFKNMTPFTFWFTIDAIYFAQSIQYQLDKINNFRDSQKKYKSNVNQLFSIQDDQAFILKIRKLISKQKGTLNLEDIKSTNINQVIEILESYSQELTYNLDNKFNILSNNFKKQQQDKQQFFSKNGIPYDSSDNLFRYLTFQEKLIQKWIKQDQIQQMKPKCNVCGHSGKLMICSICQLQVHYYCYPIYTQKQQKREIPEEQQLAIASFTCENCKQKIQRVPQCALCPCPDGYLFKTSSPSQNYTYKLLLSNSDTRLKLIKEPTQQKKQSFVNKYIHLTCFIWNPQCKYNNNTGFIEGLENVKYKKYISVCDICGIAYGAIVSCFIQNCRKSYHPQCARRKNLSMNYIKAVSKKFIQIYCPRHQRQKNYQILKKNNLNNFKDLKKFFQNIDRQIKRYQNLNPYMQKKLMFQYDLCSICQNPDNNQKKILCKSCRKWYHIKCGNQCLNCYENY